MSEQADAVAELRRQFRGPLPAGVEALDAESARDLAGALRSARRRQGEHLVAATDESLRQLPRLLRPLVRKVIGL
ncbi:hypothetical protein [Actinokineospora sp. NBRC 105648]|uniref:hypothetical protein n=1 Tax=Actinokineospora sp. NBRC 105648 TaxID=3032206 RepID=UPI00249F9A03|nr:hypothetical protein [Actinokineospora sp. NBRC 105648]GLZ36840.1 hypothetical protein Acsp05_04650 [Actinokineospora sp. NBRC 105648]